MFDQSLDKPIDLKTESPSIEVSKIGQKWVRENTWILYVMVSLLVYESG